MKRAILFLAIGGIVATVALCAAAASPGPAGDSSEIEQLKQQVEALAQRVESLEKRLNERASVIPRGRALPPMVIEPNSLPGFRSTPRDWKKFEFNGMPYYIVPIDIGARPAPGK